MQGRVLTLKPDGGEIAVNYDKPVPLDDLQKGVEGWIEIVPDFDTYGGKPAVAFVNEEGKLKGLPFNAKATDLWAAALGMNPNDIGDEIVGNMLIVTGDDDFMASL